MERFTGLSGEASRGWRKSVAAVAKSKKSYVRTVKFPLDCPTEQLPSFESISTLFDVSEGTGPHSLFGLLTATHLAGFRFFANSRQSLAFRELGALEQSFRQQWLAQSNIAANLSPRVLIEFVKTPRRKQNNVEKPFNLQSVSREFAQKTGITNTEQNAESAGTHFITEYVSEILTVFSSWRDLNERADRGLKIFDLLARKHGFDLPPIAGSLDNQQPLTPSRCPISFDPSLLRTEDPTSKEIVLHQVVAQKLKMLRDDGVVSPKPREIQDVITTATNNALSWLFGAGFLYWRDTEFAQILVDFGIPPDAKEKIAELQSLFQNTPIDPLFGSPHYANFRSSVGGKIDSWIANYMAQILKIKEALDSFETWQPSEQLATEAGQRFFRGLGITHQELIASLELIARQKDESRQALNALLGQSNHLPTQAEVLQIEAFSKAISAVAGSLAFISNAIKQDLESDSSETARIAEQCNFAIPKWLKSLPRVNEINGGAPNIERELAELQLAFRSIRNLRIKLTESAKRCAEREGVLLDDLETFVKRENELLQKRRMIGVTPESQAKRQLLNRLCNIGKSGSEALQRVIEDQLSSVFVNAKDLRRLLNNGLGAVYVSPFSKSKHQSFPLDDFCLEQVSPIEIIRNVRGAIAEKVSEERSFTTYRDLLRVENLADSVTLAALPEQVPATWLPLAEVLEEANIPDAMKPLLQGDNLTRQTVIRLNNLLTSQLNGALAKAFRRTFFIRTKFMRVGVNELHWVPKIDRTWTPPRHVEESNSNLGESISLVRGLTNNPNSPIVPTLAAEAVCCELTHDFARGSNMSSLFQQLPHDWYLDLKLAGAISDIAGYGVNKKRIRRSAQTMSSPVRLVGVSASKNLIDQWLCNTDIKIGEHNLLFEQHYEQTVVLDDGLNPHITVEPTVLKAEVALTITDERVARTQTHPISEAVIGIDLGEAGIGYAIFKSEEIQRAVARGDEAIPYESGSVPVRSVRDLISRVKRHRKTLQPNQRFRQGASTALEKLRDGALGDVTFVIDALCAKHKGFPVLETSVANLASGGKQLQLIYDKIVNTYFFSDVDAHKLARRHHWAGAENWEHPTLGETKRQQGADGLWLPTGARQKLKLFPGSAVHPAGTSQTCSACKRNPFRAIENSVADDGATVFQIINSRVKLASGEKLLLRSKKDPAKSPEQVAKEHADYKRRKERAPFQYAIAQRHVDQQELRRLVARQLRHGQKSLRSKDTTQSAYTCVFDNCGHKMHADENAAINIVRKWVKDRGIH